MPRVSATTVQAVVNGYSQRKELGICLPSYGGRRGHPVLFGRDFFEEIQSLSGDQGARELLRRHHERVLEIPLEDPGILQDVDRPEDLKFLAEG